MSRYQAASARFASVPIDAGVRDGYNTAASQYAALFHGMCSTDVAALADDLAASPIGSPADWSRVDASMPEWSSLLPQGSIATMSAAMSGSIALPAALDTVAHDLAVLERLAAADAFTRALPRLGYHLDRVDGERTSAVEARRGHDTFLLVAHDGGRLEMDHLLLADGSCEDVQRDIVDEVRREGLALTEEAVVQHRDPRGGSLTAAAARAGGASLAEGAVRNGDAGLTRTLLADPGSRQGAIRDGRQR